jgi:hypothetical protein
VPLRNELSHECLVVSEIEAGSVKTVHTSERKVSIVRGNRTGVPPPAPKTLLRTTGNVFQDGSAIEPVRDGANPNRLELLLWSGKEVVIESEINYSGNAYAPCKIDPTILQVLSLPTRTAPYYASSKLLAEIAQLIANYTSLPANSVAAVSRWALATWFPEILPAPGLAIVGPNTAVGRQLMQLLHCFCRRPLLLTDVSVAGLQALPSGWDFSLLISQSELSVGLQRLLSNARKSIGFVPRRGQLLKFRCAVATYAELNGISHSGLIPSLEIPVLTASQRPPLLNAATRQQITEDFQPKLLRFRLEKFSKALNSRFETPELTPSMQELAVGLTACTPDDPELQAQVPGFLRAQDREMQSAAWLDINFVLIETILASIHDGKKHSLYVAEIAEEAEVILSARGENRKLQPRAIGPRLGALGLNTEPRDRKGIRLVLSENLSRLVHDLALRFSVPLSQKYLEHCDFCKSGPGRREVG